MFQELLMEKLDESDALFVFCPERLNIISFLVKEYENFREIMPAGDSFVYFREFSKVLLCISNAVLALLLKGNSI